MSYVRVKNLTKHYEIASEVRNVLRNVDFTLNKGDFALLVGASGSGKTTFLNQLTGIDTPTSGEVTIGEMTVTGTKDRVLTKWRARNIGIVFQSFLLLPTLTVLQNVVVPLHFSGKFPRRENRDRAMYWLGRLGIQDQASKTPDMLSGGQQQRVAIVRALATDPPFIVGDELTANLDSMSAENVFAILRELAAKGTTVLVVSHDRELMRSIPRLFELHEGHIQPTTMEQAMKHRTGELTGHHLQRSKG
jgi:putative ABC transport system ATP-binding protein